MCSVQNNVECNTYCILETDCKKNVVSSAVLSGALPDKWERGAISSFGFTTFFVTLAPLPTKLISFFVTKYFSKQWSESFGRIDLHKKLVNVLLRLSISSTVLPTPIPSSESLLICLHDTETSRGPLSDLHIYSRLMET